jgi:hypothetical protein
VISRTQHRFGRSFSVALLAAVVSCSESKPAGDSQSTPTPSPLAPGEVCDVDNRPELHLTFDPPSVVVAPGQERPVRLIVEPDLCVPASATFTSLDAAIATAPATANLDLRHPTYDFVVKGGAVGATKVQATMGSQDQNGKPYTVTVDLPIDVREAAVPTCSGGDAAGTMNGGAPVLRGQGALAKAYVSAPAAAFSRTDEYALPEFPAEIACSTADLTAGLATAKLVKLGPAITFNARAPMSMTKPMRREVEVAIPVNPALMPRDARQRHIVVLYTGPRMKTPKPIAVANPRIEQDGTDYVLKFMTPWFGTFQAAVEEGAGSRVRKRKITHRAVIGVSMGGGGAGIYGVRHHDKFDVLAPLGGPSDWTWLLYYIEQFALGGFCPDGQTCPKVEPNRYPMDEPYGHTQDFEHWYYEKGQGNGGSFPRSEYVQIFEDLALSMGNPNGENADPKLSYMVPGPSTNDPWVRVKDAAAAGLPEGTDCSLTVEPIKDDPNQDKQRELEDKCRTYRCKNPWIAPTGFYDDEYNPDGSKQVISFCDGGQKGEGRYVNTWAPGGNKPVNLMLAVDLNKNGVRDQGEPVIRMGHERYDDCGADALCNAQEPGYDAVTNPDPNQDDYDYQLNPSGLEGNHRWDAGEKYDDHGLDGVPSTAALNIHDRGEGDGKYTEAPGLSNFYANDPHAILSGRTTQVPGGPVTDDALRRIDILSDGGIRDLFNFANVSSHLAGQLHARRDASGLPLRSVAFYNGFQALPGVNKDPLYFVPTDIRWADIADMPTVRYGDIDATPAMIDQGDGQHVGSVSQLLARLETTFFYVAKAWPDADRTQTEEARENAATTTKNPALGKEQLDCEISGRCEHIFEGPTTKRVGPIAVSLPPGYSLQQNVDRNTRYPVMYVLHGYGQDPRDLEAVAIFTNNFMNVAQRSSATRLAKFIIVYVDGRCRVRADGKPECIRGTFYMDSARSEGAKLDSWFDEVVDFVDQTYRTMPTTEVEVRD